MRNIRAIALVLLASLLASVPIQSQTPGQIFGGPLEKATPDLREQLEKIRDAALTSDYAYRQLRHLSNNLGPRLAGSPQAQFAAEYVGAEMRRLGLAVTLEKTKVPHWVRGIETGALTEYPGQAPATSQKIVLTALGGSNGTPPDGITADVVVV